MAPALILGIFLIKRKTRVFPYFIGVYELFTMTLFIFLSTATWACNLWFLIVSESILWLFGAIECT
jgi:hypothetical protein